MIMVLPDAYTYPFKNSFCVYMLTQVKVNINIKFHIFLFFLRTWISFKYDSLLYNLCVINQSTSHPSFKPPIYIYTHGFCVGLESYDIHPQILCGT